MGELLLITDDRRRGERLARDLGAFRACRVLDLYEDPAPATTPGMILSDVSTLTSDAVLRLQRTLKIVRGESAPYLFLVHGNAARAEAQARLLGASQTLGAAAAVKLIIDRLDRLGDRTALPPPPVQKRAIEARRFIAATLFADQPISPSVVDMGTDLVERAVRETSIRDWVRTVQRFDDVTHQHVLLVAGLSVAFGGALGFAARDRHRLAKAALLHDIGKTRVPPAILNKPGRLEGDELRVMRSHAAEGHAMLAGAGFEEETLAVVRSHHEMLDGSGYPDGLRGGEIPDLVRLVTVCDIYAALIERRPYKTPMPPAEALIVLGDMVSRLDGDLVRAFRPVAAAFSP
ncbi:HD domain-containing protein [Methylobacterium sp. NEAU 140]|uniref:HD-GYP domain-containing protein n=1 Tax=Methylobacterium sp. NEAU 140 TaxID=3064945 RepID=UPI00273680F2|nr:HD domain-containing phosphohydrolase [Methylobacterium sp. NEAU 140]MDP4027125.1 HD domain-containing protein [Methylobacterium sp. NEAU 140]